MQVQKLINAYGGPIMFANWLTSCGRECTGKKVAVWKHRGRIPDNVIITMLLHDQHFDPREYGWEAEGG